tara:strand:+ start:1504 stop:2166 length:663 start_codon:yes stop_codon:yes gene_type:complete
LKRRYNKMNVLVLAAHPDDETLGLGATIARLSDEGHHISLITFTNGIGARNIQGDRNDSLERVGEILGISNYTSGDFPDNMMDTVPLLSVCNFIENNVSAAPDIIFTHHRSCLNVDHQIVNRATLTAFRPQYGKNEKIYSYYVPSSTDYNPSSEFNGNVYYNVTDYVDKKIQCLRECYDGEMRNSPHARSYENVKNLMKVWGSEVGIQYAEKFEIIREIL